MTRGGAERDPCSQPLSEGSSKHLLKSTRLLHQVPMREHWGVANSVQLKPPTACSVARHRQFFLRTWSRVAS